MSSQPLQANSARAAFTEDPLISSKYGHQTWRAEQSIIDLLQNHLDAHQSQHPGELPRLDILLRSPSEAKAEEKWVSYADLENQNQSWRIEGFRVHDRGAGFNHGFLGLMGASTKSEDPNTRGGLGEGLKMSVAHLLRESAAIRMGSFTPEGTWSCNPAIENESVIFKGRETKQASAIRGSFSEVILPAGAALGDAITKVFDSRSGKAGLSRYVLDFQASGFEVHRDCMLKSEGESRAYVKGLFIEPIPEAIFSYNFGNKWAITGRDRKNVSDEKLAALVTEQLAKCGEKETVAAVLNSVFRGIDSLESRQLSDKCVIEPAHKQIWRNEIEATTSIVPGKKLLAPKKVTDDLVRRAREHGFEVVKFSVSEDFQKFVDSLYPEQIVTWHRLSQENKILEIRGNIVSEKAAALLPADMLKASRDKNTDTEKENAVPGELSFQFNALKTLLTEHITKAQDEGRIDPNLADAATDRLKNLRCKLLSNYFDQVYLKQSQAGDFSIDFPRVTLSAIDRLSALGAMIVVAAGESSENAITQDFADRLGPLPELPQWSMRNEELEINADPHELFNRTAIEQRAKDEIAVADARSVHSLMSNPTAGLSELQLLQDKLKSTNPYFDFLVHHQGQNFEYHPGTSEEYRLKPVESSGIFDTSSGLSSSSSYMRLDEALALEIPPLDIPTSSAEEISTFIAKRFESSKFNEISNFKFGSISNEDLFASIDDLLPDSKKVENATTLHCAPDSWVLLPVAPAVEFSTLLRVSTPESKTPTEYLLRSEVVDGALRYSLQSDHFYLQSIGRKTMQTPDGLSISPGFGVLKITSETKSVEIDIPRLDREPELKSVDRPEMNRGSDFLPGKIDICYGQQCWDSVKRLILDTAQNHMDADHGLRPELEFEVRNANGEARNLSEEALRSLSAEWQISQFSLIDHGAGYSTEFLVKLGLSTKRPGDRGQFGEGLKLLVAACIRNEIKVSLRSRDWVADATSYNKVVPNYESGKAETFPLVGYALRWKEEPQKGSRTTFALPTEKNDSSMKFWNELSSVVDPRLGKEVKGLDRYVLSSKTLFGSGPIEILEGNQVFEQGLLIDAPPGVASLGYNFLKSLTTTRERNDWNLDAMRAIIKNEFSDLLLEPRFAIAHVASLVANDKKRLEYEGSSLYAVLNHGKATLRLAFEELYGANAVLSWQSKLQGLYENQERSLMMPMQAFGLSFGFSAGGYGLSVSSRYDEDRYDRNQKEINDATKIVANEVHLKDSFSLINTAVSSFHVLSGYGISTTAEVLKEYDSREVTLSPQVLDGAMQVIQAMDSHVQERLDNLWKSDAGRQVLSSLGLSRELLDSFSQEVATRNSTQIRWNAREWPNQGEQLRQGPKLYAYNVALADRPEELAQVHRHELIHRISGAKDFSAQFQKLQLLFCDSNLLKELGILS